MHLITVFTAAVQELFSTLGKDGNTSLGQNGRMRKLQDILALRAHNQAWLARELGVSDAALSRWVHGHRHPSRAMLRRIATILECEVQELTGEIETMTDVERRWLKAFRDLSEDKKRAVLTFLEALSKPPDDTLPVTAEK